MGEFDQLREFQRQGSTFLVELKKSGQRNTDANVTRTGQKTIFVSILDAYGAPHVKTTLCRINIPGDISRHWQAKMLDTEVDG